MKVRQSVRTNLDSAPSSNIFQIWYDHKQISGFPPRGNYPELYCEVVSFHAWYHLTLHMTQLAIKQSWVSVCHLCTLQVIPERVTIPGYWVKVTVKLVYSSYKGHVECSRGKNWYVVCTRRVELALWQYSSTAYVPHPQCGKCYGLGAPFSLACRVIFPLRYQATAWDPDQICCLSFPDRFYIC